MILTPGEKEDPPDEDKWQTPKEPADLVSLPDDIEDHPQEGQE
jgi:hypothetical protein